MEKPLPCGPIQEVNSFVVYYFPIRTLPFETHHHRLH